MATASRRRFPALLSRRNGAAPDAAVEGVARLGRRTKDLVKRLVPGDVAVIDHVNIDRIAAEELIATGVRAVLNASQSSNGRYPNAGPLLLARAGVLLVDFEQVDLFEALREGDRLSIDGGVGRVGGASAGVRVFRRGREPEERGAGAALDDLLAPGGPAVRNPGTSS